VAIYSGTCLGNRLVITTHKNPSFAELWSIFADPVNRWRNSEATTVMQADCKCIEHRAVIDDYSPSAAV
jgi:hypothetical protein